MNPDKKLQKLTDLLKLVDESISREEFTQAFKELTTFVRRVESSLTSRVDEKIDEADQQVLDLIAQVTRKADQVLAEAQRINESRLGDLKRRSLQTIDGLFTKMRLSDRFNDALAAYEAKIDELEGRISAVPTLDQILKNIPAVEFPEIPEVTADEVREKLESLKDDERIDAKAIKNLPPGGTQGPPPALWALPDVEVSGANTNATIQYNPTGNSWQTGVSITVSATEPTDPKTGDLWVDTA